MSTKKSTKKLDKEISQAYAKVFNCMAIPIFDVSTIYKDVRNLVLINGLSVESVLQVIRSEYQQNESGHYNRTKKGA